MILVDIYVPSMDETYDFQLDENAEIEKIILEVVGIISKKTKRKYQTGSGKFMLYATDREEELLNMETLASCGIHDGDRLLLV